VWDGTWSVVLSSSTDGGQTYGGHTVVHGDVVPPERVMLIFTMPPPTLAVDAQGGMYAGWYDIRNGDWDVFVTRSTDRGRTWGPPQRVNDDPLGNGRHQSLPKLWVAPGGRVDIIFNDRRDDPGNERNHVYYSWSSDGGNTFAPNRRLTSESSHTRVGVQYVGPAAVGLVEFGSRLGLESTDDRVVAAWTDTRIVADSPDEPPDVIPRANDQGVYATEVLFGPRNLPPPPQDDSSTPWGAIVGGLAVAAAAGVAAALVLRRRTRARPQPGG
jgi:hypothetical protein